MLLDAAGQRFTDELAPRDQVAAAILDRMRRRRLGPRAARPARARPRALPERVRGQRATAGLDPRREPVPVAPAAHYLIGGIATDLDGRTTLPGLFAVGECACTGCTAPTGWRRTRSASASCSEREPRRAALEPLTPGPPPPSRRLALRAADRGDPRGGLAPGRARAATRRASSELLDDPYPLARLIAGSRARAARVARRPPALRPSAARSRPRRRAPGRRAGRRAPPRALELTVDSLSSDRMRRCPPIG